MRAGNISGRVDDAEKLDGIDSSGFVQGKGSTAAQSTETATGVTVGQLPFFNMIQTSYACPSTPTGSGQVYVVALQGPMFVFVDAGDPTPFYGVLQPGDAISYTPTAVADIAHVQANVGTKVLGIDIATSQRAGACHVQEQAFYSSTV